MYNLSFSSLRLLWNWIKVLNPNTSSHYPFHFTFLLFYCMESVLQNIYTLLSYKHTYKNIEAQIWCFEIRFSKIVHASFRLQNQHWNSVIFKGFQKFAIKISTCSAVVWTHLDVCIFLFWPFWWIFLKQKYHKRAWRCN